jgi:hypothetical protein
MQGAIGARNFPRIAAMASDSPAYIGKGVTIIPAET